MDDGHRVRVRVRAGEQALIAGALLLAGSTFAPLYRFDSPAPYIPATYSAWTDRDPSGVNNLDDLRTFGWVTLLLALVLPALLLARRAVPRGVALRRALATTAVLLPAAAVFELVQGRTLHYGYAEWNHQGSMRPGWGIVMVATGAVLALVGTLRSRPAQPPVVGSAACVGPAGHEH